MIKLKFGGIRKSMNLTKNINVEVVVLKKKFLGTLYTLCKTIFCLNKWGKFRDRASYGLSDQSVFNQLWVQSMLLV